MNEALHSEVRLKSGEVTVDNDDEGRQFRLSPKDDLVLKPNAGSATLNMSRGLAPQPDQIVDP